MARGGMHAWQGVCISHMPLPPHPARYYEIQSVNARAVRILLECILVVKKLLTCLIHDHKIRRPFYRVHRFHGQ